MSNLNDYLKNIHDLLKNSKLDEALNLCDQNNQTKIDHIIFNFKGVIYLKKENFMKSQESFLNSIKSKKDFIDPYKNLFLIYDKKKEFSNLLKLSFQILDFDKTNAIYNFQTAYALEKNGIFEKSIKHYNEALNLGFIDKKKIFNNLVNIYFDLKKIDKSIELYEKAYLENKKDKILLNNLIGAHLEKRDAEKSKAYLDEAKKLDTNYSIFKYHEAK